MIWSRRDALLFSSLECFIDDASSGVGLSGRLKTVPVCIEGMGMSLKNGGIL